MEFLATLSASFLLHEHKWIPRILRHKYRLTRKESIIQGCRFPLVSQLLYLLRFVSLLSVITQTESINCCLSLFVLSTFPPSRSGQAAPPPAVTHNRSLGEVLSIPDCLCILFCAGTRERQARGLRLRPPRFALRSIGRSAR